MMVQGLYVPEQKIRVDAHAEFGALMVRYKVNRQRIIVKVLMFLTVIWFAVVFLIWQTQGFMLNLLIPGVALFSALALMLYLLPTWENELAVYEHGFSVRRGGQEQSVSFDEVDALRGKGERRSYLGGLVEDVVYRFIVRKISGEVIVLGDPFRDMEHLSLMLEHAINRVLKPVIDQRIQRGELVSFSDTLSISAEGLLSDTEALPWSHLRTVHVRDGQMIIYDDEGIWYARSITEIDNLRLLVDTLNERAPHRES